MEVSALFPIVINVLKWRPPCEYAPAEKLPSLIESSKNEMLSPLQRFETLITSFLKRLNHLFNHRGHVMKELNHAINHPYHLADFLSC